MIFQISSKSSELRARSKSSPFNLKILNDNLDSIFEGRERFGLFYLNIDESNLTIF